VFPFSNHNYDLRYWLAAAGIHPDRDVRLVAVPPPLMVDSLRLGVVDGFCVGEPWNSVAVQQGLGSIVVTQSQLMPHSVEKVLALRDVFAQRSADVLMNLLRALDASAAWADDPTHHATLAESLARPEYLALDPKIIFAALSGRLRLGAGRTRDDPDFMVFRRRAANVPDAASGAWAYAQMVRWGQVAPNASAQRAAASVMSTDLYRRALPGSAPASGVPVPFDGLRFSPDDVAAYLAQFALDTPFAAASAS
jgi:ABC-type nitrate/sulfonate/bicarbonate transport system substrate-binding protein